MIFFTEIQIYCDRIPNRSSFSAIKFQAKPLRFIRKISFIRIFPSQSRFLTLFFLDQYKMHKYFNSRKPKIVICQEN